MSAVEWLFPAVLLADLDLEPINLSDQFVLTYLAGDVFPAYTGSFCPGTIDLGLGFRLGFLRLKTFISENKLNCSKCSEGSPKIPKPHLCTNFRFCFTNPVSDFRVKAFRR